MKTTKKKIKATDSKKLIEEIKHAADKLRNQELPPIPEIEKKYPIFTTVKETYFIPDTNFGLLDAMASIGFSLGFICIGFSIASWAK